MTTRKWGAEFQVNTQSVGTQDQPVVTALSDGGFVILWCDRNPAIDEIRMQRFDAAGISVGNEVLPYEASIGVPGSDPSVDQLANGNLLIGSTRDYGGGDFDAQGQVVTLAGADVVNQPLNTALGTQWMGRVASLGSLGSAGVYEDLNANSGDIFLDIVNAAGTFVADNILVNGASVTGEQSHPDIAVNPFGDRIAVAWADYNLGQIRCKILNYLGADVSVEFTAATAIADIPAVEWIQGGRIVVAWQSSAAASADNSQTGIYFNIFNADGSAVLSRQLANTTTFEDQQFCDIAALPDGGFVIAWEDFSELGPDGSGFAVRLQAFDALGGKRGGEFTVNTTDDGSQYDVSLATLADGRVVVTWADGFTGEIMAQIVDTRDGVVNGTSSADTLYGNDGVNDEISGFASADTMSGLGGDDVMHGGQGADTATGGRGDDIAYGGAGADTLNGNQGDDQLFGGKDADTLTGGKGDDEYYGGAGNDVIFDAEGDDTINGGADTDKVDYVLATKGLTASLDGTLTATGAAAGDTYISIEQLSGTNFDDILRGDGGANAIFGRSGDDRITGAGGKDTLVGNTGNDTFAYGSVLESGPAARDQINDFTVVAGDGTTFVDRIDLSAIDAIAGGGNDAFLFIGTAAFSAPGQVRVTASGASDTLVEINTSGTSGAEMTILLKSILPGAVFDEDFVL